MPKSLCFSVTYKSLILYLALHWNPVCYHYYMSKAVGISLLVIVLLSGIFLLFGGQNRVRIEPAPEEPQTVEFDPLNASYLIEGRIITLLNGRAETPAGTESDTAIATTISGEPARGDISSDGQDDAALILIQDPGGTGTFYYVAAALSSKIGAKGTDAIFLGDRIAPKKIEIQNGQIIVNYLERSPEEPMASPPSIEKKKILVLKGEVLQEIDDASSLPENN